MMSATPAKTVAKKSVAKKTEDVVVPAAAAPKAVAAPAPAPVAVEAKKAGRKPSAKEAAPAVVAPVVAAPVVATPAVAEAPATTLDEDLKGVLASLTTLRETVSSMITEVKRLDKRVHREIKDARKRKRRVRAEGEEGAKPRGPSIFEIPTKVTDELCLFLGHSKGTLISRSNVTKQINNYVKEKNLKNKHDITPDGPLRKLLQVPESEQLTYFNLQRYLNRHYIKAEKPTA